MKKEIWHRVGIKATPAAVYLALTDKKKLAQWWTTDVRGDGSKEGSSLEFWFGSFVQQLTVHALKNDESVRWKATEKGLPDWKNTEIEFSIAPDSDQTFVTFAQVGWTQESEMFPHYSTKWAVFLLSLKDLLETGKGHPSPHDVAICH